MKPDEHATIEAESISTALKEAESLLQTSRDNIDFKIVTRSKKGFVFPRDMVTVEVWRKNDKLNGLVRQLNPATMDKSWPEAGDAKSSLPGRDGSVEIAGGLVKVVNPRGGGRYPTLIPDPNVEIYLNGSLVVEETIVMAEDQIELVAKNLEPLAGYDVEVSEDGMEAFLVKQQTMGKEYRIRDIPPSVNLRVRADVVKETPPPRMSLRQIRLILEDRGIVYGVDEGAITQALLDKRDGTHRFAVAVGQPPVPGRNGAVKYFFKVRDPGGSSANPYGTIQDYSVQIGEVLAMVTEPEAGLPGTNVFGNPIEVEPPRRETIQAGEGVRLAEDGRIAVAGMTGRPKIEGGRLSISPVYVVEGDVDVSLGSLAFRGDVEVTGDVLEGFSLVAGGNITVRGNVIRARLKADGKISVMKNIISSTVDAGRAALAYKVLGDGLEQIIPMVNGLFEALKLLKGHAQFKVNDLKQGDGLLVQLLIDNKFKSLPKKAEGIFKAMEDLKVGFDEETGQNLDSLKKLTGINPLRIKDAAEIFDILRRVGSAAEHIKSLSQDQLPSNVVIEYAQNSSITASGDILVSGRGCLTTVLSAGGSIYVNASRAVFRGGELKAAGKIMVTELGSHTDVPSVVKLEKDTVLEAELVHPAVIIESAGGKYRFEEMSRLVKAYSNSAGKPEVEKLKA